MTMTIETVEAHWIEARGDYTTRDLAELSGLPLELVDALIAHGALSAEPIHAAESVVLVRRARRLRDDFELDPNGFAVALSLLRRMRALEREIETLRSRLG